MYSKFYLGTPKSCEMSEFVPETQRLEDVYYNEDVASQIERWTTLFGTFTETYGHRAKFVARSPGRINIIGEHIDYNFYEV